jgi:hypothetical protein
VVFSLQVFVLKFSMRPSPVHATCPAYLDLISQTIQKCMITYWFIVTQVPSDFSTPSKSKLCLAKSLVSDFKEKFLTFHIPNIISFFQLLRLCQRICSSLIFHNMLIFNNEVLQARGTPLVSCPQVLLRCVHRCPPIWRCLLHLQPEDKPWHVEKGPI